MDGTPSVSCSPPLPLSSVPTATAATPKYSHWKGLQSVPYSLFPSSSLILCDPSFVYSISCLMIRCSALPSPHLFFCVLCSAPRIQLLPLISLPSSAPLQHVHFVFPNSLIPIHLFCFFFFFFHFVFLLRLQGESGFDLFTTTKVCARGAILFPRLFFLSPPSHHHRHVTRVVIAGERSDLPSPRHRQDLLVSRVILHHGLHLIAINVKSVTGEQITTYIMTDFWSKRQSEERNSLLLFLTVLAASLDLQFGKRTTA